MPVLLSRMIRTGWLWEVSKMAQLVYIPSINPNTWLYDYELEELGKSILLAEGRTEDEIAREGSEKLKAVGREFRSRMPSAESQKVLNCKVCRYPRARLEELRAPK